MLATILIAATISSGTCDIAAANVVVADVNTRRVDAGERPLVLDAQLTAIARDRAEDLLRRHYFGHVSPDGLTTIDALHERDIAFAYAGENLASAATVREAENGLWQSPDHRENILERHYRRIGIAVIRALDQSQLVVQVFTD